jgi:hypothetical protein
MVDFRYAEPLEIESIVAIIVKETGKYQEGPWFACQGERKSSFAFGSSCQLALGVIVDSDCLGKNEPWVFIQVYACVRQPSTVIPHFDIGERFCRCESPEDCFSTLGVRRLHTSSEKLGSAACAKSDIYLKFGRFCADTILDGLTQHDFYRPAPLERVDDVSHRVFSVTCLCEIWY